MRYAPARPGDKAGLAAFQRENFHYLLAVALADGKPVVRLEKHAGPNSGPDGQIVAEAPLTGAPGAPVYLKIDARGATYDFSYATRPGQWISLAKDADGTILSTKTAGGFVGVTFGLFAYAAP
jgi:alpha-N-arabinofuranosidase